MHDHVVLHSRSGPALPVLRKDFDKKGKGSAGNVVHIEPDAAGVWEKIEEKLAA